MLRWTCFAYAVVVATTFAIAADPAPVENDIYRLTAFTIPAEVVLEVGAMDLLPDGRLAVSSRRGEIWRVGEDFSNDQFSFHFAGQPADFGRARVPARLARGRNPCVG